MANIEGVIVLTLMPPPETKWWLYERSARRLRTAPGNALLLGED